MTTTDREQNRTSVAPGASRLLYMDNIRLLLITLVVIGHLGITYGAIGDWYYQEQGAGSEIFSILAALIGAFLSASLLGLFCLISGYFTPRAYDRKGAVAFLVDRCKRLALPLAFYEIVLNPFINYVRDVHKGSYQGSFLGFVRLYFSQLDSFGDGPVWFLLMILIFSIGYTIWRLGAAALAQPSPRMPAISNPPAAPSQGVIALFALGLGLLTFVVRIWAPFGKLYEPWHQELAHYPQYVCMFVAGMLAYRRGWLATFADAQARLWAWLLPVLAVALVGIVAAAGAFSGAFDERVTGGFNPLSLAYSVWEAWTCVAVSITLLAWFRRRFDRQGPLARAMAAASFAVYVFHPAIIVPLPIALSGVSMNLSLKFLWVTPLAVALCYLVAHYLRKLPGLRSIL